MNTIILPVLLTLRTSRTGLIRVQQARLFAVCPCLRHFCNFMDNVCLCLKRVCNFWKCRCLCLLRVCASFKGYCLYPWRVCAIIVTEWNWHPSDEFIADAHQAWADLKWIFMKTLVPNNLLHSVEEPGIRSFHINIISVHKLWITI